MAPQGFYNAMLGGSDYVAPGGGGMSAGSSCFELEAGEGEGSYTVKNCVLAVGSRVVSCDDKAVSCTSGYIFCTVTFSQAGGEAKASLDVSAGPGSDMKTSLVQFSRPLYRVMSDGTVVDMRWGPQLLMMY